MVKKRLYILAAAVMSIVLSTVVSAQTIEPPEHMLIEAAPYTSDQINLIIMMLSISGTALILLLLVSFLKKNKKK